MSAQLKFKPGSSVLANWQNEAWCLATVISIDAENITVIWDDDYSESKLLYCDVRAIDEPCQYPSGNDSSTSSSSNESQGGGGQNERGRAGQRKLSSTQSKSHRAVKHKSGVVKQLPRRLDPKVLGRSVSEGAMQPEALGVPPASTLTKAMSTNPWSLHCSGSKAELARVRSGLLLKPLLQKPNQEISAGSAQTSTTGNTNGCNATAPVQEHSPGEGTVAIGSSLSSDQDHTFAASITGVGAVTKDPASKISRGRPRSGLPVAPQILNENKLELNPSAAYGEPSKSSNGLWWRECRRWVFAALSLLIIFQLAEVWSQQFSKTGMWSFRVSVVSAVLLGTCWYPRSLGIVPGPIDWSIRVRVCIHGAKHGASILSDPPVMSGAKVAGSDGLGKGLDDKKDAEKTLTHTNEKTVSSQFSERLLDKFNKTGKLEDALLSHLNHFFQEDLKRPPAEEMILEYVDYGDQESKNVDGRVEVEKQRGLIFVPLDGCSRDDPVLQRLHPADSNKKGRRAVVGDEKGVSGKLGRWVSVTPSGDVRMAVCAPAVSKGAVRVFLEAYGTDCFQKLQDFIHRVMDEFERGPANAADRKRGDASGKPALVANGDRQGQDEAKDLEDKQLFWYTLMDWHLDEQPLLSKRPIYKDSSEYYQNYHTSLFFDGKERIMGKEYSLVDQFQQRTGNYAVPGVQRKLNFLLHGPPGTGKSKFARALAMYTRRHVVAFTLRQIDFQPQLVTMLDDPRQIWVANDKRELARSDYMFQDLLFVIEEIDVDGDRKVCWQRQDVDEAHEESESEAEAIVEQSRKKKKRRKTDKVPEKKARLSLDFLLRTLDGGCDAPGRMIVMTTNRMHLLDVALMRPGRVKQVHLTFVGPRPFKQMVCHFRNSHGAVPIHKFWTSPVDHAAQVLLDNFQELEQLRSSDLDRRQLGLAPALLEEKCMEAHTLAEVFQLLADELQTQWERAGMTGQPLGVSEVSAVEWQMNAWRQTALHHVEKHVGAHGAASREALDVFKDMWPEGASELGDGEDPPVLTLVRHMIRDEGYFNDALEDAELSIDDLDLTFRAQIEVSADIAGELKVMQSCSAHELLGGVLYGLMQELSRKWRKPQECKVHSLVEKLQESPPSSKLYDSIARECVFLPRLPKRY